VAAGSQYVAACSDRPQIPDRNGKSYLFFLVGENLYAARIHFFLDFLVTCRNSEKQ
jgi:hypothetical protein